MHAYLIVGNNEDAVEKEISILTNKLNSRVLEFTINKIDDVRELNRFLSLTQPENTIIKIRNIDEATPDALNAFLKNLEEPQKNVTFVLTANSENKVLPTILSRCQVIRLGSEKWVAGSEKNNEIQNFLNYSIGERLKYINKIKKRDEAITFIKDTINNVHQDLKTGTINYKKLANNIKYLQKTLDALNQNGNVTIQLTNLIVHLDIN